MPVVTEALSLKQYIPSAFVDAPVLLHMMLFNNSKKTAALKQMHV